MIVTSWHPCLVKAARVGRPAMMSTMTIISPLTLLWLPTNGDGHLLPINSRFSKTLLYRAMSNDERDYPEPHVFKPERFLKNGRVDNSVRDPMDIAFGFGRRWAFHVFSSNIRVIPVLVEFVPGYISLIQLSLSLLLLFCQLLTWWEKWMRMVKKLNPRWNILNLGYGEFHFRYWLS